MYSQLIYLILLLFLFAAWLLLKEIKLLKEKKRTDETRKLAAPYIKELNSTGEVTPERVKFALNYGFNLEVSYKNRLGKITAQIIKPCSLTEMNGHYIMKGLDEYKKKDATFVLDRLISIKIIET